MTDFYALDPAELGERLGELGREALALWDLHQADIELVEVGENGVFRVTDRDSERYALRIHRFGYHTTAAIRSELQWIRALEEDGMDVPQVRSHDLG